MTSRSPNPRSVGLKRNGDNPVWFEYRGRIFLIKSRQIIAECKPA